MSVLLTLLSLDFVYPKNKNLKTTFKAVVSVQFPGWASVVQSVWDKKYFFLILDSFQSLNIWLYVMRWPREESAIEQIILVFCVPLVYIA